MKIIIILRGFNYGVGTHVRVLLHELDERNDIEKVLVISQQKVDGYSKKIMFDIIPPIKGYFITREPYFAFLCNLKIRNILKNEKYDLIHSHFAPFGQNFGIPWVATIHGLHYQHEKANYSNNPAIIISKIFHKFFEYIFDRRVIKYANKLIFVYRDYIVSSFIFIY